TPAQSGDDEQPEPPDGGDKNEKPGHSESRSGSVTDVLSEAEGVGGRYSLFRAHGGKVSENGVIDKDRYCRHGASDPMYRRVSHLSPPHGEADHERWNFGPTRRPPRVVRKATATAAIIVASPAMSMTPAWKRFLGPRPPST